MLYALRLLIHFSAISFLVVAFASFGGQLAGVERQSETSAQQGRAQVGTISGKVLDGRLRVPVEGAQVVASRLALHPDDKPDYHSTDSRADGSFVLTQIPFGTYIVSADKDGYVFGSCRITVSSSRDITTEILLQAPASITGRVLDEEHHGIPGLLVGAWTVAYQHGRPVVMQSGHAITDRTGTYQVGQLRRGTYFVGVLPPLLIPKQGNPSQAEMQSRPTSARAFYSASPTLDGASKIPVEEGQQVTGIDIAMRTVNGYCITGSLPTWLVGGGAVTVTLSESGSSTELWIGTGRIKATRRFHFCGVPSGDYVLSAVLSPSERKTSWVASEAITVDKGNVTAEPLSFEQARELRGHILVDKGQLIAQRPPEVGVRLEPVDRLPFADEDTTPTFGNSGHFVFHRLYLGRYWVNITSISPGYYVSSISTGRHDGLREPIDIDEGDLVITVRSDAPSLAGTVTNEDGSDLTPVTTVALIDDSSSIGPVRTAHVDQTGRFSFDNLAPGSYSIVALSGLPPDQAEDPSIIRQFTSQARQLSLGPYTSQEVQLHPISTR